MQPSVHQEPPASSFCALVVWVSMFKWYLLPEVPLMWVIPFAFLFGVVVPLSKGLPRPNSRLIQFPAAINADCSAGMPLQAAREKVSDNSTQVPNSPAVFANQQPWVAPVVPYKASNACEYPAMLFSTRTVEQVPRGNMSALEGDAVSSSSSSVDLFKKSKPVQSTRSQPKLLQGMAMHKAMQKVYGKSTRVNTATAATRTTTTSSFVSSSSTTASASPSSVPASTSATASSASSIDELCEALIKLDIAQATEMPDFVPGTPELREIVENEDRAASERAQTPEVQEVEMASPPPSPPPPPPQPAIVYTQPMMPQQEQAILYTQVMPAPQPIIHPAPTPEVVVAAVAAGAIPIAISTGSSTNMPLQTRRPFLRPKSRLRTQHVAPPPASRPPPEPPSLPPRPQVKRLVLLPPKSPSLPPQPPTPPASESSAMALEAKNRAIVRPVRRLQRHVTLSKGTENTTSTSASSSSSAPSSSSASVS
ncbi:hypothetical protein LRAMOSA09436 [Lichtheimia ramosa]|uniref:Uncharacterized protein n=1 Tax=Lichtheimia ramosa TaxID=688394 RepID=A0A077WIL4_9FUNG|nr:hypothetical protein LRAMOSA09436 [Lichtheimia ramosa]